MPQRKSLRGKLAVLEVRSSAADITKDNARFLTDVVRQVALQANPEAELMTRENLLVLLDATGKKLEDCEGECEVETGRRLGAESIVSGDLGRLGTKFNLSLRLHDTRAGRLLSSVTGSAASGDELQAAFQKASRELFSGDRAPQAAPRPSAAPQRNEPPQASRPARCRSDIECPGDEICTPQGCALEAAPATRCSTDLDCRSDQVCTPQGCALAPRSAHPVR